LTVIGTIDFSNGKLDYGMSVATTVTVSDEMLETLINMKR
jgi:hypothetical protein